MRNVTWRRLELSGFGLYRGRVTAEFQPGLNVLVAPNEHGKSTLVAGLAGVIFGLPGTSDTDSFGQGRFRNWTGPADFQGEVEFEVGGEVYRIRRNFANHRVFLVRRQGTGWIEEAAGEHNPRGRRPNVVYQAQLDRLLGIGSRELFEATFCIVQPLPAEYQLGGLVQGFVSGAGSSRYEAALKDLEGALKRITRFTADRGVTGVNMRNEGRLEEVTARIAELSVRLEQSRRSVDSLQAVQQRLEAANQQRDAAKVALEQRRAALAAWGEWRQHRRDYQLALRQRRQIADALQAWTEKEKGLAALRERLSLTWASFEAAAALLRSPDAVEAGVEELATCTERLAADEALLAERRGALQRVAERRVRAEEESRMALAEVDAEVVRLEEGLARLLPWGTWGVSPTAQVALARERAQACQGLFRQFEAIRRRRMDLEAELASRYAPLADLPAEARQALLAYQTREQLLSNELAQAQAELAAARRQVAAADGEKAAFERAYADIEELGDECIGAVEALVRARQEQARLSEELAVIERADRDAGRSARRRWVRASLSAASVLLLGILSGGVTGATGRGGLWGLALGIVLACLWLLPGSRARRRIAAHRRAQRERFTAAHEAAIASIRLMSGPLGSRATLPLAELGELRQRLVQRRAERERLSRLAREAPLEDHISSLAARVAAAEAAKAQLAGLVQPIETACGEPADRAVAAWLKRQEELQELAEEAGRLAAAEFNASPDEIRSLPATRLAGPWAALWQFACFAGMAPDVPATGAGASGEEAVGALPRLMRWCDQVGPVGWDALAAEAAEWERLARERSRLADRRHAIQEKLASELADLENQRAGEEAAIAALDRELAQKRAERTRRLEPFMAIWEAAANDPARARALCREWRGERAALAEQEAAARAVLQAQGAANPDELKQKLDEADLFARTALAAAQALEERHPGLPRVRESQAEAELEERYRALQDEVSTCEARLSESQAEWSRLWQEQALLMRPDVLNVAAAEQELLSLLAERDRLTEEAEVLAIAHRELRAAATEFQTTYRDRLAAGITAHFQRLTGTARRVALDEGLALVVHEPDGAACAVAQLSQGARDQLFLAVRLAIADWVSDEVRLPFVLDDPFVNFDSRRLENMRAVIADIARDRQVILLAHGAEFAAWGRPVALTA